MRDEELRKLAVTAIHSAQAVQKHQREVEKCQYDIIDFRWKAQQRGYSFDFQYGSSGVFHVANYQGNTIIRSHDEGEMYKAVLDHMHELGYV